MDIKQQYSERSYSRIDRILGQPKLDRIEENYKRILARGSAESKRSDESCDKALQTTK